MKRKHDDKVIAIIKDGKSYYDLAAVAAVIRKTWTNPQLERKFAAGEVEWWCGLLEAMDKAS